MERLKIASKLELFGPSAKGTLQVGGMTLPIHISTVGEDFLCKKPDCWICDLIEEEWRRIEFWESVKGFWTEA